MKYLPLVLSAVLLALATAAPLASTVVVAVVLARADPVGPSSALRAVPAAARSGPTTKAAGAAAVAVEYALAQIGTPYRWGGETPGVGFDCSGLVQAAWAAAGVHLPRVAQAQFDTGPLLPPGSPLMPGDLVFFGPDAGGVTHVGMVVDAAGLMVDAPHTGAFVRLEPFPVLVGAHWGGDLYLGATRPGGD
jgi:cell wall-associated NlpC family hydrolase